MTEIQNLYSIFSQFEFETKPVGLKFLLVKPKGIAKLGKKLAVCEVIKEAQTGKPFYAAKDNLECASHLILGMEDPEPLLASGAYGSRLGHFKEARANSRVYQQLPRMMKGTVNYVACAALDHIEFEPDIIIFVASPSQAAVLLRSICYTTGKILSPKATPVLMCSWLFVHPFISGEVNYTFSGLGAGMKSRQVVPEGKIVISMPWDVMPLVMENLKQMPWVLPTHRLNKEDYLNNSKKVMSELRQEMEQDKE